MYDKGNKIMVTGRFVRESFHPWVISPWVSFRPGSIRPWVVSPQFGGSFHPYFIQALWIEIRYVLVYKGVEIGYGESVCVWL